MCVGARLRVLVVICSMSLFSPTNRAIQQMMPASLCQKRVNIPLHWLQRHIGQCHCQDI